MDFTWNEKVRLLLNDNHSLKILIANDRTGYPHIAVDQTISVDKAGNILYQEFLETSQRNAALVNSLWFKHPVLIHVEQASALYDIYGIPTHSIISGPIFEECYRATLKQNEKADLSTVWMIKPQKILNRSSKLLREKEKKEHPLVMHLDHLQKSDLLHN
ncbi:MAG TPA: hypothetical protein DEP42_00430 [Ruminococcaceae bacterium]|nr:hypothetical protein [Oscillospiraceae bacterium]